jgi:hypothetical protein
MEIPELPLADLPDKPIETPSKGGGNKFAALPPIDENI